MSEEMLTDLEKKAIKQTAELWNTMGQIAEHGEGRGQDLRETIFHIHAIQHQIMAQAACRAYPEEYRLIGANRLSYAEMPELNHE